MKCRIYIGKMKYSIYIGKLKYRVYNSLRKPADDSKILFFSALAGKSTKAIDK